MNVLAEKDNPEHEIARLQQQVTELQAKMSALVNESRRRRAHAFMTKFDFPMRTTPGVPNGAVVRARLKVVAEEFFELVAAVSGNNMPTHPDGYQLHSLFMSLIDGMSVDVDMPALADALGDLDYSLETVYLAFGILADPVVTLVHETNMSKTGPVERGRIHKGPVWQPPDVAGELRRQGWVP